MEHHSSYSAPRSSRASGRTRSTASRQDQRRTHKPQKNGNTGFSRILLCYILPFLVVNLAIFFIVTATPKIEIDISDTTDYKTLDVSFKIHSLLPLKKMTTTLESQPIEFKKEKGVYHAVLESNGTLEIYALSLNGMQAQDIEHIAVLDDTAPSFDEENVVMENGKLILTIEDSISGINYDSIYATDDSGTKILPDSCDKENGEVTFKLEEGSLTVYVEDMAGNPNQAAFSINQSGINTSDRNSKFPTDGKNGMNGTEATEAENETKASEAKTSETKASETKSAKASSTKAETKASSAAKSTTAAKSSSAAKSTTAAAKSTSGAAKSTTAAQKSASAAAKPTTAAQKSTSAAAKSTTAAQKSTSAAAKSTTAAQKSTSAAAKSTAEAAKSTTAAHEPTTAEAPATIAPLNN